MHCTKSTSQPVSNWAKQARRRRRRRLSGCNVDFGIFDVATGRLEAATCGIMPVVEWMDNSLSRKRLPSMLHCALLSWCVQCLVVGHLGAGYRLSAYSANKNKNFSEFYMHQRRLLTAVVCLLLHLVASLWTCWLVCSSLQMCECLCLCACAWYLRLYSNFSVILCRNECQTWFMSLRRAFARTLVAAAHALAFSTHARI